MKCVDTFWYDTMITAVMLVVLLVAGVGCWIWLRRRKRRAEVPPQGIVLLLDTPKVLIDEELALLFGHVTDRVVRTIAQGDATTGDFVMSAPPSFIAQINGTIFLVNNVARQYLTNAAQVALETTELRLRTAIAEHKAWLSVEILHPAAVTPENYRIVTRVAARLIGRECLALYHPPSTKWVCCKLDETVALLEGEDPIDSVFDAQVHIPVIPIEDDPRVQEAEVEARRRFPDFEDAFGRRGGTDFCVKALISSAGHAEHIWIDVEEITAEVIKGRLGNDPVQLAGLRLGSPVQVEKSQVEDWVYRRGDTPVGMFSVEVIQRIEQERRGG